MCADRLTNLIKFCSVIARKRDRLVGYEYDWRKFEGIEVFQTLGSGHGNEWNHRRSELRV